MECCKSGFNWGGTPTGRTEKVSKYDAYIAGSNKDAAILIIHDIFGWEFTNTRLLADHYAKEANVTCYLVDFFDGETVPSDIMSNPERQKEFSVPEFFKRNSKDARFPAMVEVVKELRKTHKKIGAMGFCYGGWAVFKLAGKGMDLVDAVSTAHPSILVNEEISNLAKPVQIISPEHDPQYTAELKEFTLATLPKLNIPFQYDYYPGVMHGFATKGDPNNPATKFAMERAKNSAVSFFKEFLFETK